MDSQEDIDNGDAFDGVGANEPPHNWGRPRPPLVPATMGTPKKKGAKKVPLSTSRAIVATAPATTISSATVGTGSPPPLKKKPLPKEKILCDVVSKGSNMNIKQIMKLYDTSRSIAHSISVQARPYMNVTDGISDTALGAFRRESTWSASPLIEWIRDHLSGAPDPHIADVFTENWRADVMFHPPDLDSHIQIRDARRKRAEHVWKLSLESREGKEPMNTLVCVLYSAYAVCAMMRTIHHSGFDLAHVLVTRLGHFYLAILTDADQKGQFPLNAMMRRGDLTSSFIWLNLKQSSWDAQNSKPSTLAVLPTTAVNEKDLKKVSSATAAGIHIIALLWMRCNKLNARELAARATVGAERGKDDTHAVPAATPKVFQVYVQPTKQPTNAEEGVGEDSTSATAPWWIREIDTWAIQFGKTVRPVQAPPVPPPLVLDVWITVFTDGVWKRLEAKLVGNNGLTISSDDGFSPRTLTATNSDGTIAFESVIHHDKNSLSSYTQWNSESYSNRSLILQWGAGQSNDVKRFAIPRGGRVLVQIKDQHQVDLCHEQSDGLWRLVSTVRTQLSAPRF